MNPRNSFTKHNFFAEHHLFFGPENAEKNDVSRKIKPAPDDWPYTSNDIAVVAWCGCEIRGTRIEDLYAYAPRTISLCFEPDRPKEYEWRRSVLHQWEERHWGRRLLLTKEGFSEYVFDFLSWWTKPRRDELRNDVLTLSGQIAVFKAKCVDLDKQVKDDLMDLCRQFGYNKGYSRRDMDFNRDNWQTTLVEKIWSVDSHVSNFVSTASRKLERRWKEIAGRAGDAVIATWGYPLPENLGQLKKEDR